MDNETRVAYDVLLSLGVTPALLAACNLRAIARAAIYYGWYFAELFGSAASASDFYLEKTAIRLMAI